jgi:tetratricopeptide (TPR) repeat protein
LKTLTFSLGTILVVYCSAGILSRTLWSNNEQVESILCRLFLCDSALLELRARQQLMGTSEDNVENAISLLRKVLQRDAHDPYRWADLGEAFLEAGQKENARYCYGQVAVLAPRSPPLLLRVANFHFEIGETKQALPITARILALIPDYDSVIFGEYTRLVDRTDEVLQYGLPQGRRAAKSWLQFLIQEQRLSDAQHSWGWLAARGYSDDALAGDYTQFLIRQGNPEMAASVWTQHLGPRSGNFRNTNYLFNGSFELEPSQSPFDWHVAHTQGAEVARDCTTAGSGKCSLRIRFAGTRNLDFVAASQLALVRSGLYRFQAFMRTEGLTTDQGVRFRISDAEVPARLDIVFEQFTGTRPWSVVDHDLAVPPQVRLLQVQVVRQASMKFDNKVGGTAWIDDLRLEPLRSRR